MSTVTGSPTVQIVDDDTAVRRSLQRLLESAGLPARVHASARAFLASDGIGQPGCLVLDVEMTDMSGTHLQQELERRGATQPIIFISAQADVRTAVAAMQQGAFDFLQKPLPDQRLLDRVHNALRRDAALHTARRARRELRARLITLSPREREVLALLGDGHPNKKIALTLGISQRTVEIHRAHVMQKMRADSLAGLLRLYLLAQTPQPVRVTG